ncbi:tetratricopeptide repeat protein [Persicitalea sp.]|uniref:tetratricopeptide repeat protein n=1 Tax=Persicitalea sp. TaxID=3100273 RepID=UPI003593E4D2
MKSLNVLCLTIITFIHISTISLAQEVDPIAESARLRRESDERKLSTGTREEKYEIALRKAALHTFNKEYAEAMKMYNVAIEQNINSWIPYYDRAPLKQSLGDYRGAADDYLKLETQLSNGNHRNDRVYIIYNIAICKENIEDYEEAIKYFKKCINIQNLSDYHNSIAKIYYKLKNYQTALQYLNEAIELDPNDNSYFYNKGLTLIKIGKTEDGCKALSRSGELGSSNAYAAIREHCQ